MAADATRLSRFLTLTGTDPQELNNWDGNPAIQAAVLDHFLADESLLLVFTGEAGVSPQEIAPAQAVLAGAAAG